MQFRPWNSFNLLAVILLAIGIIGAVSGGHMVFDPGRIPSGKEWIVYLVAGVLMLVNGFLPSSNPVEVKTSPVKAKAPEADPSKTTVNE